MILKYVFLNLFGTSSTNKSRYATKTINLFECFFCNKVTKTGVTVIKIVPILTGIISGA